MKEAAIIFPHQLFEDNPIIQVRRKVYLVEEYLFFKQYRFHKQKLALHRATMKFYEKFLRDRYIEVEYIHSIHPNSDIRELIERMDVNVIHFVDLVDNYLNRRISEGCRRKGIKLIRYQSPGFINIQEELSEFFKPTKKKFLQTEFYTKERKKRGILIDDAAHPIGGRWTFDVENRKKYPKDKAPPKVSFPPVNSFYDEAVEYVERYFSSNPGSIGASPLYPIDFESAKAWLEQFLQTRFSEFGDYEDAIVSKESILNHSLFSPLINIGLLTPGFVIDEILKYAGLHDISVNNTEGIIRQLIGWREFIRGVYEVKGSEERTCNFWRFKRKIPSSFYDGTTDIEPVDSTIKKLLKTGYNHHIERLMILGNFMLLCEFDPDEVYQWFMELYIDAYDWVMVPNVYGMSQFADGGLMSTKPYISGSNYIMKMSDFKKGTWNTVWDGLFWRFMDLHRDFFLSNPRLGMLIRTFDKMSEERRKAHHEAAENFLLGLGEA
ncbi:MAG: cryptochrome/photolyase family protein [Ekhidna sp.]|nr:cryptochrome/photolyase family protein [Ekhidna sp.]